MVLQDYKIDGEYICISKKELEKLAENYNQEKACEWLYVYYPTLERAKSFEDAWEKFKKAMEE